MSLRWWIGVDTINRRQYYGKVRRANMLLASSSDRVVTESHALPYGIGKMSDEAQGDLNKSYTFWNVAEIRYGQNI